MEKRNVIKAGVTPDMDKQAEADQTEAQAVAEFRTASKCAQTGVKCPDCGCDPCITKQ